MKILLSSLLLITSSLPSMAAAEHAADHSEELISEGQARASYSHVGDQTPVEPTEEALLLQISGGRGDISLPTSITDVLERVEILELARYLFEGTSLASPVSQFIINGFSAIDRHERPQVAKLYKMLLDQGNFSLRLETRSNTDELVNYLAKLTREKTEDYLIRFISFYIEMAKNERFPIKTSNRMEDLLTIREEDRPEILRLVGLMGGNFAQYDLGKIAKTINRVLPGERESLMRLILVPETSVATFPDGLVVMEALTRVPERDREGLMRTITTTGSALLNRDLSNICEIIIALSDVPEDQREELVYLVANSVRPLMMDDRENSAQLINLLKKISDPAERRALVEGIFAEKLLTASRDNAAHVIAARTPK